MADGNPLSSLYPQPPQPQQGLLSDPARMLSIMPGLMDYRARQAVGNALSQSVDQQGNFDPNAFSARVAADPVARLRAVEAVQQAQQLREQQFQLATQQRAALGNMFASFAGDKTADPTKVMDFVARGARATGI